jgi:uncharacterized lipoprotein YajG
MSLIIEDKPLNHSVATIIRGKDRQTQTQLSRVEIGRIVSERANQIENGAVSYLTDSERMIPISSQFINHRDRKNIVPSESVEGQQVSNDERRSVLGEDGRRYIEVVSSENIAILEYNKGLPFVIYRTVVMSLEDPSLNTYEEWFMEEFDKEVQLLII